jgi:hypothetical protein
MKQLQADATAIALSFSRTFVAAVIASNAIDFRGTRGWDSLVLSAVIAGGNAALHTLQSLIGPATAATDPAPAPAAQKPAS